MWNSFSGAEGRNADRLIPYPVRQINRKEDLYDTPTPSSRLQVFDAYMKTGKLGKKDC